MTVAALSGGKDSTAMLHLLIKQGKTPDRVYFFDTEWEFPCMYEHLNMVERKTGLHIEKIRSYRPFDDLLLYHGWPKTSGGWCSARKRDVSVVYERAVKTDVVYIGFSADEVSRAEKPTLHKIRKWKVGFPLIEAGMSERDCLRYCLDLGYHWNGLYEHISRVSCFCCPKAGKSRLQFLQERFPELYAETLRKQAQGQSKEVGG